MTHTYLDIITALSLLSLFLAVFVFLFFYGMIVITKRLDRYRLKYGFDREIESKDIEGDKEYNLYRREKRFKNRVFKD